MEIGPLSEWVGALASFSAVLVALFLPYYQENKRNRKQVQRLKKFLAISQDKIINAENTEDKERDLKELDGFIKVNSLIAVEENKIKILEYSEQLFDLLKSEDGIDKPAVNEIMKKISLVK
ncbi:hypothetical protein [Pediococcus argentinicus]|nr:hypothetical protein [Pediococcus argentinicus]NKZ21722.1 hypothetical protein [Pediococcus argentinicus]GEP18885.1 hypothetical protein LSA03_02690 [Pediococcus argentinicus]